MSTGVRRRPRSQPPRSLPSQLHCGANPDEQQRHIVQFRIPVRDAGAGASHPGNRTCPFSRRTVCSDRTALTEPPPIHGAIDWLRRAPAGSVAERIKRCLGVRTQGLHDFEQICRLQARSSRQQHVGAGRGKASRREANRDDRWADRRIVRGADGPVGGLLHGSLPAYCSVGGSAGSGPNRSMLQCRSGIAKQREAVCCSFRPAGSGEPFPYCSGDRVTGPSWPGRPALSGT